MIEVTQDISINENEIVESFIRASGPGGQNVNKVSTAVQLRFDVDGSDSLSDDVKGRLRTLAGKRMTKEGVIVLTVDNSRVQSLNRQVALSRLTELIRKATIVEPPRILTKPTYLSKQKRIEKKVRRGQVKKLRSRVYDSE